MSDGGHDPPVVPPRILLAGLLALAAIVYLPTLGFGFVYDDHWTLLANGFLRCPEDLGLLFGPAAHQAGVPDAFRPTAVLFDTLTYQLFGAHAHWHHATNVALHVGVCAALWKWLSGRGHSLAVTAASVAIFSTLAIHAEVVAVVSYREDLLAAALGLWALTIADRIADGARPGWHAVWVVLLSAAACGAKWSAVVLPAVWLLARWLGPAIDEAPRKRRVAGVVALGVGTAIAVLHQVYVVGAGSPYDDQVGIHAAAWSRASVLARSVQIQADVLGQMIVPVGLSPEYVDRPAAWGELATILCACGLALAIVHAVVRARVHRTWAFVALSLVVLSLPTANLWPMPNMRADRFAYLPSISVALGLGVVLVALGRRLGAWIAPGSPQQAQLWATAPVVVFVVVHGAVAQATATTYKTDGRLWEIALRHAPDSARAHALLGEIIVSNLRDDAAADPVLLARASAHCARALALAPDDALPHLCAARLAVAGKHWPTAHAHFELALARARAREDRILTALASVTLDLEDVPYPERVERVDALLARAQREFPYASEIAAVSGRIEHRLGRADRAFTHYRRARKLRPERWDIVLWGLELALDLGDSRAAWTIWRGARDLLPEADPRWVDATRRRVYDALATFPDPSATVASTLPLTDLAPESSSDDP